MTTVVIAGGGIGGVAAALALAGNGHRAVVLERNREFTELGAGIQLGPNAFRALDQLGVVDRVREGAVFVDELSLRDGVTGLPITALPLGEGFRRRYGYPYAVVHRVDLYTALLDACAGSALVDLRTTCAVRRYSIEGSEVVVELAGGGVVRGDALIGADGIRSTVRAQLVGDGEPRVSGHTIYRSVVPIESVPEQLRWNSVTLWAAPKRHVVHYPIAGGRYFNLAATVDDAARSVVSGEPVDRELVLDTFASMADVPRAMLEYGEDWRTWVLCDRDPVPKWTDGRVVLLGDAAHPMLQYAAQGACMALEDAVCLAGLLQPGEADFAHAFETFNQRRFERTSWTQQISRMIGEEVYHPSSTFAEARNASLSAYSVEDLYEIVDGLYQEPAPSLA